MNGGWNHIFRGNAVNEFQTGLRRQTEGFQTKDDADFSRIRKSDVGYTLGQLNPQLNTLNVIPRVIFGLNVTGTDPADFTYDNRLGNTAQDYLYSFRDNITWTRGRHTLKAGGYLEYMQNNEARGGNWMGEYQFTATPTTRSTPGSPIRTPCSACSSSTPKPTGTARPTTGRGCRSSTRRTRGAPARA